MPHKVPVQPRPSRSIKSLGTQLDGIHEKWRSIDGKDKERVRQRAMAVLHDEFFPWAAEVLQAFASAFRPRFDSIEPPAIPRPPAQAEQPTVFIADTPTVTEAGMRLIFWAAAANLPPLCDRSPPSYTTYIEEWAKNWVVIHNPKRAGAFRTFHQPLDWVKVAFNALIAADASDSAATGGRIWDELEPMAERPAAKRDALFLRLAKKHGLKKRFRNRHVLNSWNAMTDEQRMKFSPFNEKIPVVPGKLKQATDVVRKAIAKAIQDEQGHGLS